MKLRNKKTGEIKELKDIMSDMIDNHIVPTFIAIETEWEDYYEEFEECWFIRDNSPYVGYSPCFNNAVVKYRKEIGNYFKTKEEAEKAVEKLKAVKLLKDMGFKIEGIRYRNNKNYIEWSISQKVRDDHFMSKAFNDALHLVFGGQE